MISAFAVFAWSLAAAAADERIVCVPKSDGSGWECGQGAAAPAPRPLPREHSRATPTAPPVYLMDPSRYGVMSDDPTPTPVAADPEPTAPAAVAPLATGTAPAVPEATAVVPEPLQPEPVMPQTPAALPEPVAAITAPAAPATPAPTATESAAPVSASAITPATASAERTTAAAAVAPVTRSISSVARDANELLALPGSAYTVQLAATRSAQGFAEFRQRLGVAVEDTFVIRVRRGNEDWWLMLWRDFPDLASARSAAATLHGSYWPRRLAPLQTELRATPN